MKGGEKFIGIIEKNVWGGKGFLKRDGMTVFVTGGIEGQKVEYEIIKHKKKYCEAKIIEIIEKSPFEIPEKDKKNSLPGCGYQNIRYSEQLRIKKNQLEEIFRNHDVEISDILPSPETEGYRNKMEFSCGYQNTEVSDGLGKRVFSHSGLSLGFHPPQSWSQVISIPDVFIASKEVNILREKIELMLLDFVEGRWNVEDGEISEDKENYAFLPWNPSTHKGFWRGVIFRESRYSHSISINFVVSRSVPEYFWKPFIEKIRSFSLGEESIKSISSILQTVHTGKSDAIVSPIVSTLYGESVFEEALDDMIFDISPFSFFQTNTQGAEVLYATVKKSIGDISGKNVLDLFCGTGSIGIFCASQAKKVVGIEMVEEAVKMARKNALKNRIINAEFFAGKVENILPEVLKNTIFDAVIIDPPRSGMHPKALQYVCSLPLKKLVYISCNPTTLERDAKSLKQARGWKLTSLQGVDMFPHTPHLEVVSVLERE